MIQPNKVVPFIKLNYSFNTELKKNYEGFLLKSRFISS